MKLHKSITDTRGDEISVLRLKARTTLIRARMVLKSGRTLSAATRERLNSIITDLAAMLDESDGDTDDGDGSELTQIGA